MDWDHFMRPALRRLLLAVAAALAVSGAAAQAAGAFTATAGIAVSGPVGTFTTSCLGTNCSGLNPFVTIGWGDGSAPSRVAAVPACPAGCANSDWRVSAPDGTTSGPQDAPPHL